MSQNKSLTQQQDEKLELEKSVVIIPSILLIVIIAFSTLIPGEVNQWLSNSLQIFGETTGLYYQLSVIFVLVSIAYFACSKYGDIKFGNPDEKPEYSLFDWGAMVFCTCMAGGTIYWASMEPLMHLKEVPFDYVQADSTNSMLYGMAFMLLRPWWIWGLNVFAALPIAYLMYIKRVPLARYTQILEPFFGAKVANGLIGKIVNITFVFALMLSYAGGIAVSIPIAGACISYVFGFEHTMLVDLFVLLICTALYIWSSFMGMKGGIRVLSRLNVYLCFFLAGFILILGPTMFILSHISYSFGLAFDNFFTFLLCKNPYWNGTFAIDWAQFQILWNYSSAPLLGLFIARVSRGRTVREIIVYGMLCGVLGLWLNYGVVGCYSLYVQHTGIIDLETIMQTKSKAEALLALFQTLPFSKFMMLFTFFFIAVFSATTIDSAAFVTSAACCKHITPMQEPPRANRIYWALVQGAMGLSYMLIGGLTACRVMGSYSGFLLGFLVFISYFAWFKYIKEYRELYMKPVELPYLGEAIQQKEI